LEARRPRAVILPALVTVLPPPVLSLLSGGQGE